MATLLIADHSNGALSDQTAPALTAALAIGAEVHLVVAGRDVRPVAKAVARLDGVSKVLVADDPTLEHQLAEPMAALLVGLADLYDALIAPASTNGKNYMPRVAALLGGVQIYEIVEVVGPDTFRRPIYAGNAIEVVQTGDPKKVITVRTSSFPATSQAADPAPIEEVQIPQEAPVSSFVSSSLSGGERPELTSAKEIVSGGRALGSAERFEEVIFPVADRPGAAIGASRAAVDAGYAPNDWQVGQTGKVVAPDLYVACGISGAIQHLAGMKDSKVIVAINKDPEAPIFQIADYGLVADIFVALPELARQL